MPIFEFVCRECRHRFERVVQGAQRPACPKCDGRRLERQISSFSKGRKKMPAPNAAALHSLLAGRPPST
ncbi:MAG: zinc ribbon domain-containing protein [Acidobacteriia bacterium]|nr:zinc ribbon domain-containing protein [Terriglobia bacterium]